MAGPGFFAAELDACERVAPGKWAGTVTDHWMVGKIPSGGYITVLALQCVTGELAAASTEPPKEGEKRRREQKKGRWKYGKNKIKKAKSSMGQQFLCPADKKDCVNKEKYPLLHL